MKNRISIIAACIAMSSAFCAGQGWLFPYYCLSLINSVLFTTLNYLLARSAPEQRGMYLMMVPAAWAGIMASYGIWRLSHLN